MLAFNAHGESRAMSLQAFTTQPPLGTLAKEPSQVGRLVEAVDCDDIEPGFRQRLGPCAAV